MARDPLGPDGWDGELPRPPAATARWDGVLGLLDAVDARHHAPPDPPREPRFTEDGALIIDWSAVSSPVASSLVYLAHDLVDGGFDWSGFVGSPRGRLLLARIRRGEGGRPGSAGDMTLEECRMFLVALARQERFVDGAVDGAIRSGFVGVVLRRARELLEG